MKRVFGIFLGLSLLILSLSSCGNLMTNDKFTYLGHGPNTPVYQLYYDKTKKMFILVDKEHGCMERDDSGLCMAFTLEQTKVFREQVLAKMIAIDRKLAKESYGREAVKALDKAGISTIKKPINIGDVEGYGVKQVIIDREKQYSLVRGKNKVTADLIATVVNTADGQRRIKVFYVVNMPVLSKSLVLTPFIIDPEFLYESMTLKAEKEATKFQTNIQKNNKEMRGQISDYLGNVVDGADVGDVNPDAATDNITRAS